MAPDNFQIKEDNAEDDSKCSITTKVDVWAFGCILSEIFSKEKPWKRERDQHQIIAHLFNKSKFIIPEEKISNKEIVSLIENCTNVEPHQRIPIKEAKEKLVRILYEEIAKELKNDKDYLNSIFQHLDSKRSDYLPY
jgi:serine/threonine protein kinase